MHLACVWLQLRSGRCPPSHAPRFSDIVPPSPSLCSPTQVGFVASFASKLADTTSSEIGKAYGRTTYLVTTLQRVPRGTEGAVSAEGTAAGVAAAAVVAGMAVALGQASGSVGDGGWRQQRTQQCIGVVHTLQAAQRQRLPTA